MDLETSKTENGSFTTEAVREATCVHDQPHGMLPFAKLRVNPKLKNLYAPKITSSFDKEKLPEQNISTEIKNEDLWDEELSDDLDISSINCESLSSDELGYGRKPNPETISQSDEECSINESSINQSINRGVSIHEDSPSIKNAFG